MASSLAHSPAPAPSARLPRYRSRRGFLRATLQAACTAAATACGFSTRPAPAATPGAKTDQAPALRNSTYHVQLLARGPAATLAALNAAARDFNDATPDVRLHVNAQFAALSPAAFADHFIASVAEGTAPDLVHLDGRGWQGQAVEGFLQPLDEFASRDNWSLPWPREEAHELQTRFRGKRYLSTFSSDAHLLWYVPLRFVEAGVPLPRADWTYADFQDAAIKLTRVSRSRQLYGYRWNSGYLLNFSWWRLAGQQEWDRAADPRRAYWNTAAVIEAFQFQLFDSQYRLTISPTARMLATEPDAYHLETGSVAMHMRAARALADLALPPSPVSPSQARHDTSLDVQLLPRGRASKTSHLNLVDGQVLTRASKDKEAAWSALQWLGSEAGQVRVAENDLMCSTAELNRRFWLPLAKRRYPIANVEAFVKAIEGASVNIAGEVDEQTLNRDAGLDAALAAIRDGDLKAKDALDTVQPRIQRLLNSYWEAQARAR